jgi:hypothetical protein
MLANKNLTLSFFYLVMPLWNYEIEGRENVEAFLKEMIKELGKPYEAEGTIDIDDYVKKRFIIGKLRERFKSDGVKPKIKISDLGEAYLDFNPDTITGEQLIALTRDTKGSCFGLDFKYADDSICVCVYNDWVSLESSASSIPKIVKKYGKKQE